MDAIISRAKPVFAEFVAMTLFVYVGCGSVFSFNQDDALDKLGIALAFGLSITSLAYTVGHVSGGHMNPIVTIGACILGQLDILSGVFYIIAQLLGSVTATILLSLGLVNDNNSISDVVNGINRSTITPPGAFVMETILSFLLVYVVAETAINNKSGAGNCAPIAIGIAVFMAHIVAIPFTGCSINPARSFGPAVVSGNLKDLWMFFAAPITGGVLAALSGKYIFGVLDKNVKVVVGEEKLQYDRLFTPVTDTGTVTKDAKDTKDSVPVPVPIPTFSESRSGEFSFPISMAPLDEEGLELRCETP